MKEEILRMAERRKASGGEKGVVNFMTWFVFYLKGFMQSFAGHYQEEFARSLNYCRMIYGYRDNRFFLDQYEDHDEFCAAARSLLKSGDIPFNRVKTNL